MAHDKINSVSEPWLLLPLFYTLKSKGSFAEYNSSICYNSIQDFIKELPNKEKDYLESIKSFTEFLYNKTTGDKTIFFLDKTPRYYFIIPEIAKTFPDAKFIFLFRNPLSIISSMVETWHNGKFILDSNYKDLYIGPKLLTDGYKLLKEKSIKINYEKLVKDPDEELKKIFKYLELDFDKNIKNNFQNSKLLGGAGDPFKDKYRKIQKNSIDEWKNTLNTKFRQKYVKKYLNYLGDELINSLGYNKNELINEVLKIKRDYKKSFFDKIDLITKNKIISNLLKIKSNIKFKIVQKIPPSIKNKIKKTI
jgi:hypothetical protein